MELLPFCTHTNTRKRNRIVVKSLWNTVAQVLCSSVAGLQCFYSLNFDVNTTLWLMVCLIKVDALWALNSLALSGLSAVCLTPRFEFFMFLHYQPLSILSPRPANTIALNFSMFFQQYLSFPALRQVSNVHTCLNFESLYLHWHYKLTFLMDLCLRQEL